MAGVHAFGQVVHFDSPAARAPQAWMLGSNARLPPDISIRWVQPVTDDFSARFSALRAATATSSTTAGPARRCWPAGSTG